MCVAVGENREREKYVSKVCKFIGVCVCLGENFNDVVRLAFISGQRKTRGSVRAPITFNRRTSVSDHSVSSHT